MKIKPTGYYAIVAVCPDWVDKTSIYNWYGNSVYTGSKVQEVYNKISNKEQYTICEVAELVKVNFKLERGGNYE